MRKFLLAGFAMLTVSLISAKEPDDSTAALLQMLHTMDSIENSFHYQTGKVTLPTAGVVINVPSNFKFLGSAEAKYVVEELWGNPPSSEPPLGLLLPANGKLLEADGYAYIVSYDAIGFVKDGDAKDINYEELMTNMKKEGIEANKERDRLGLDKLDLIDWAAKPYYDSDKKVLHWAKEYWIKGQTVNTLNYDVRVLGRKGVLTLQAVSTMDQLDSVNAHIPQVLGMVNFTEGNRYADFDEGSDHVAEWTIGGLVAGKVLAKVGFFAVILKFLKFIILGIIGFGAAIWRWITGRKKEEPVQDYSYQPELVQSPASNDASLPGNDGRVHSSQTPIPPVS